MEYDNTNRGALFKNENPKSDRSPPYSGQLNVNGVEYWLSAWVETSQQGKRYFSVSVQPKQPAPEHTPRAEPDHPAFDDEIPF